MEKSFDLYRIGKWGAIVIIVYYLLTEHQAHVVAFLPYLILLACPLIHIFMHGSHGNHENHQHHQHEKERQ
ncbi:MAG: hypothetical protein A4S09_15290 [Proteobacteria bacterium SG_bin7]|nr:MAG: hypothetical protein A4S09_15290 [Proteobacteria bacterium SG_bin7]